MSVTTTQFILMVIGLVAMIWGLYAIFRSWQTKQNPVLHLDLPPDTTLTSEKLADMSNKDGVPIVPRHERQLSEEKSGITTTQTVSQTGESLESSNENTLEITDAQLSPDPHQVSSSENLVLNTQVGTTTTITADGDIYVSVKPKDNQGADQSLNTVQPVMSKTAEATPIASEPVFNDETDAFSALANATEAITPVVQTYDESQLKSEAFRQNSPILDTHIQAQIDYEQNSPLHNAEQNINISIFPRHQLQRFAGKDFLGFVDKYGLKYGAMNMFHRYENKDGTGILWFSVMMVENQVPSPFDLNKLPMQHLDGLILFLSLPHPEAGQAFESMISLAKMMANDLNAELYDDVGELLSGDSINLLKSTAVSYGKPL